MEDSGGRRGGVVAQARNQFVLGLAAGLLVGASAVALRNSGPAEEPVVDRSQTRSDAGGIQGLWEVTSVQNLTKGEEQPLRREYYLFGESHHMVVLAGEGRPKLDKSFSEMSPEEIMSQQPVGAGFYRYTVSGTKLERTNVLALSAYYEDRTFPGEVRVQGDTLVMRDSHSADGDEREWTMRRVE